MCILLLLFIIIVIIVFIIKFSLPYLTVIIQLYFPKLLVYKDFRLIGLRHLENLDFTRYM